ncbi:hypothetical protein FACS189418_5650 [Clostridia bacterium]|nr:hypothetical protein FACS189418_5650 [Clostridia bacterium]
MKKMIATFSICILIGILVWLFSSYWFISKKTNFQSNIFNDRERILTIFPSFPETKQIYSQAENIGGGVGKSINHIYILAELNSENFELFRKDIAFKDTDAVKIKRFSSVFRLANRKIKWKTIEQNVRQNIQELKCLAMSSVEVYLSEEDHLIYLELIGENQPLFDEAFYSVN